MKQKIILRQMKYYLIYGGAFISGFSINAMYGAAILVGLAAMIHGIVIAVDEIE